MIERLALTALDSRSVKIVDLILSSFQVVLNILPTEAAKCYLDICEQNLIRKILISATKSEIFLKTWDSYKFMNIDILENENEEFVDYVDGIIKSQNTLGVI